MKNYQRVKSLKVKGQTSVFPACDFKTRNFRHVLTLNSEL